jgi:hypothetical protein
VRVLCNIQEKHDARHSWGLSLADTAFYRELFESVRVYQTSERKVTGGVRCLVGNLNTSCPTNIVCEFTGVKRPRIRRGNAVRVRGYHRCSSMESCTPCVKYALTNITSSCIYNKYVYVCVCVSTFTRRIQKKVLFTVKRSRTHVYKSYLYRVLSEGRMYTCIYIYIYMYFSLGIFQ